jgi:hypothetical protein
MIQITNLRRTFDDTIALLIGLMFGVFRGDVDRHEVPLADRWALPLG